MGEMSPPTAADYASSAADSAREKAEEALKRVKILEETLGLRTEVTVLKAEQLQQPYPGEPLWKSEQGWYFWNEKLTEFAGGPYASEHEARIEMTIYAHQLNFGPPKPRVTNVAYPRPEGFWLIKKPNKDREVVYIYEDGDVEFAGDEQVYRWKEFETEGAVLLEYLFDI